MSLVSVSKAKLETGLGLKEHWEKAGGILLEVRDVSSPSQHRQDMWAWPLKAKEALAFLGS